MALEFESLPLKDFLNAFYKEYADFQPENKQEFKDKLESYKQNYEQNKNQNEPAIVANALAPLFESLGFQTKFAHKHKGNSEIDLALLKDSNVEILIEAKKPDNVAEMFKADKPNCKALHECILYYLREKEQLNFSIKYIIITNFLQFYIFNAREFERHFCDHSKIKQAYQSFKNKILNQDGFYTAISKILNNDFAGDREGDLFNIALKGLYFDLRNDKHLSIAHKILTRDFLHREYKRDPNALNPRFYKELLHILGLKEFDKGGKITIELDSTQSVSFAKHIASKLESDNKPSDFEAVMSHILIWLNRVLFLKLIEANLLHFNDFNKDLRFLSGAKITSFKHLSHLFFEVLAKDYAARKQGGGGGDKGFNFLPYLNSSLFIRDNALEILDIGTLDDDLTIQIFESTQTAHTKDKTCKFLTYLFDFLNAFDFGKESNEDSTHKDLIRSSVLGAVFEKLNGYKEGSFYTPSFITSYMCRESLSKIVIDKFNAAFAWSAQSLEDLRKQIDRDFGRVESQAKRLLEGIKICDPSVGSGHFLVSALNEMIAIYHKLGLLGFGYKDLQIKDDEIHLTTKEGETFAYKRLQDSNHAIQIALFTLKKSIIENNLFGVDINPNSCNIARLRLWIELLKNAYYLNFSKDRDSKIHKLQTLPNIDINIKCGNSLISHIDTNTTLENFTANLQDRLITAQKEQDLFLNQSLNSEIKDIEKKAQSKFQEMRENAESYKDENDKQVAKIYKDAYEDAYQYLCELFKRNCDEYINFHQALKEFFYRYGYTNLTQLELETKLQIESYVEFFEFHKSVEFERKTQREIPQKELENLLNLMQIYEDFENKATFEWRFAFPEVLDSNGDFLGFDLIIGNPPYIRQEAIKDSKESLKHYKVFIGTGDLYTYFYELGYNLLRENGILNFITSNKWCRAAYGEPLRRFLLENTQINTYLDLNGVKVFESAAVDTSILQCAKTTANANHSLNYANPKDYNPKDKKPLEQSLKFTQIPQDSLNKESFTFSDEATQALKAKIEKIGTPLKDWDININYGIKTGYNEAFIIDSKKREEILNACANEEERARTKELIKPILRGRNIKRYSYEWAGLWIIGTFPALKLDIDDYPAVKRYLESFMPRIAQSGEKGCRKKTSNKWFETQDNIAYYDEFAKPKISWQRVTQEPSFIIESGYYLLDSMAFLTHYSLEELRYLLGFLNSKAIFYYFKNIGHLYSDKGFLLSNQYVERFPIPKISNISKQTHKEIMECVREILTNKKQDSTSDTKALESRLDSLIYQAYGLNEKEINLIESELSTREREREQK